MKYILIVGLILIVLVSGCVMSGCSYEKFTNCINLCVGAKFMKSDDCLKVCTSESYAICGEEKTIQYLMQYGTLTIQTSITDILNP